MARPPTPDLTPLTVTDEPIPLSWFRKRQAAVEDCEAWNRAHEGRKTFDELNLNLQTGATVPKTPRGDTYWTPSFHPDPFNAVVKNADYTDHWQKVICMPKKKMRKRRNAILAHTARRLILIDAIEDYEDVLSGKIVPSRIPKRRSSLPPGDKCKPKRHHGKQLSKRLSHANIHPSLPSPPPMYASLGFDGSPATGSSSSSSGEPRPRLRLRRRDTDPLVEAIQEVTEHMLHVRVSTTASVNVDPPLLTTFTDFSDHKLLDEPHLDSSSSGSGPSGEKVSSPASQTSLETPGRYIRFGDEVVGKEIAEVLVYQPEEIVEKTVEEEMLEEYTTPREQAFIKWTFSGMYGRQADPEPFKYGEVVTRAPVRM